MWFIFKTCILLKKHAHFCSDRICEVKTMAEERHLMMISWSGETMILMVMIIIVMIIIIIILSIYKALFPKGPKALFTVKIKNYNQS